MKKSDGEITAIVSAATRLNPKTSHIINTALPQKIF